MEERDNSCVQLIGIEIEHISSHFKDMVTSYWTYNLPFFSVKRKFYIWSVVTFSFPEYDTKISNHIHVTFSAVYAVYNNTVYNKGQNIALKIDKNVTPGLKFRTENCQKINANFYWLLMTSVTMLIPPPPILYCFSKFPSP